MPDQKSNSTSTLTTTEVKVPAGLDLLATVIKTDPRQKIAEADCTIDELMERDPLEFSDQAISTIVRHFRAKRLIWLDAEKEAAASGKNTSTKNVKTNKKAKLKEIDIELKLEF